MSWRTILGGRFHARPLYAETAKYVEVGAQGISAYCAHIAHKAPVLSSAPIAPNGTGASAENRVQSATSDRVVLYVDFAARGAAAYARWLETAEAGEGAP